MEVKTEILRAFPSREAAMLFHAAWNEISMFSLTWGMYRELFNGDKERIELLKWSSPWFFVGLKRLLADDLCLRLTRLTDPRQSCRNETASLEQLIHKLNPHDAKFAEECKETLEQLRQICKAIREHRNRALAHKDLGLTLNPNGPSTSVRRETLEKAFETAGGLLNRIERRFGLSATAFGFGVIHGGGVDALIASLEVARDHEIRH